MSTLTLVHRGMGGFLNPPGDAEHVWSVQDAVGKCAGSISLRYALTLDWVPEAFKVSIRDLIAAHPPQFTADWEQAVYKHLARCYSPDGVNRDISAMVHSGPAESHLAYLHIKQFFPNAAPNLHLIEADLTRPPFKPTPMSSKRYQCSSCGHVKSIATNHYGECYGQPGMNTCPACSWKHPLDAITWKCLEVAPDPANVPKPWA